MRVLIVESKPDLGRVWQRHLQRMGACVTLVQGQQQAIDTLAQDVFDVIILDLVLEDGNALDVSDFASYRQPDARVLFVTNTTFFSDGSIFAHAQNACACMPTDTKPEDLVAMVEHYGAPR